MAFESNRPFGFSSGFEPGHEDASPFGASHPEIFGLGTIGEAARQMSQFPVIAGGGGGVPIPGFSQVEGSRPERGAHDRQQGREGDGFDQNARIGRKRALPARFSNTRRRRRGANERIPIFGRVS